MNKKVFGMLFILLFVSLLPGVFAGLKIIPNCHRTTYYTPRIIRTEFKCGDCTRAWTQECRTLYRVDIYNNCTAMWTPIQTRPQTDYSYCYNGRFEKINWKTSYECRGNTSYMTEKAVLPPSFKWAYEHTIPRYCPYGCNKTTGKCNETRFYAPLYKFECQKQFWQKYWWSIQRDYRTGRIISKQKCFYGCNKTTGKCSTGPRYKWECRWSLFKGSYSVYFDTSCGNILREEKCSNGCNKTTGRCNPKPMPKCTPRHYTFCKPSEPGKVYIKYIYSDCSSREFLYKTCGSCQTCSNGECNTLTGKHCTTVRFNIRINSGSQSSTQNTYYARRTGSNTQAVMPRTTSSYGRIYTPRSKWVCDGKYKVPIDVYGQKISSRRQYCPNGCYNGSCIQTRKQCTYNSDCPLGYYCAHLSNRNECKRR